MIRIVVSVIAITLGLVGCCQKTLDVNESEKYLNISGMKFRKTGSINTEFLWAGVGRNNSVNSFDPKFFPFLEKEITAKKVTEAFNEQTRKVAYEAAVKAGIEVVEGDISGSFSSESGATGTYHVFKLFDVNDFVSEFNSEKNKEGRELLMRYKNPRIITSIATVFNRNSNNKINAGGKVNLKIKNPEFGNPEFSIKLESSGATVANLSGGTVFAYEYARLCWEKTDGVVKVATIEVDRPGWDDNCPSGSKDDASKL